MSIHFGDNTTGLQVPATVSPTTTRVRISDVLVNGSGVRLFLEGSLEDKEGECYGRLHRKLISEQKLLHAFEFNNSLNFNETAIRAISSKSVHPITVYCKYRKKNLTSYRYTSKLLNYSLSRSPQVQEERQAFWKNLTSTGQRKVVNITPVSYTSEDHLQKWYSPYGIVLGGLVLLGSVFFA
jgi:hypothetical protein